MKEYSGPFQSTLPLVRVGHTIAGNQSRRRARMMPLLRLLESIIHSRRYRVEEDSMLPELSDGQYVLMLPKERLGRQLDRGDIVMLRHPAGAGDVYVKRIVGLPNETILMREGRVLLNGKVLQEDYPTLPAAEKWIGPQEWSSGHDEYFVMGDNRRQSRDSRVFGPVNSRLIMGRVWFRYWPPSAWGLLGPR